MNPAIPRVFAPLLIVLLAASPLGAQGTSTLHLTLEDAVERALAHSPALRLAEAMLDETGARVASARAMRLPTVTANVQFRWQPTAGSAGGSFNYAPDPTAPLEQRVAYLEAVAPVAGLSVLDPQLLFTSSEYGWSHGIQAEKAVFDGGRTSAAIDLARALEASARASADRTAAQVRLDTEIAYRQLLLARDRLRMAGAVVETARSDADLVCRSADRETASELDVLRAELEVAKVEPRLMDAVASERRADAHLRTLLGIDDAVALELDASLDASILMAGGADIDPSTLLEEVQAGSLRAADAAVHAADAEVRSIAAQRWPSLLLSVDMQRFQAPSEPFDLSGDWSRRTTLVGTVRVPVLTPGRRAEERAAKARSEQARMERQRLVDGVRFDHASVRAERTRALDAWRTGQTRLTAARRSAELTQAALERGIVVEADLARSRLDVLEAEATVLEAVIDYLSADDAATASYGANGS